jgi:hypothetical protein
VAQTSPVYLPGRWDARADAQYFVDWIDALIAASRDDPKRFSGEAERDEVLALYEQALWLLQGARFGAVSDLQPAADSSIRLR